MIKNKKKIIILISFILLILSLSIMIYKIDSNKDKVVKVDNRTNEITYNKEKNNTFNEGKSIYNNIDDNKENQKAINEIESKVGSATNNVVLEVNGEKVTEKEIAIIDFQLNNKYVNKNQNKKDANDEVIKQYVILQNAKEINVGLTEKEIETIENNVNTYMKKDEEETNMLLDALNMEYNEFLKFYIDRTKKIKTISKWESHIMNEINNGNIDIEDESFNREYNKYIEIKDIGEKAKSLKNLLELYEKYLQEKAKVEYQ